MTRSFVQGSHTIGPVWAAGVLIGAAPPLENLESRELMNDGRATKLLPCQQMFGRKRGDDLIAWVDAAIGGGPCPCQRGQACPLMPALKVVPAKVV